MTDKPEGKRRGRPPGKKNRPKKLIAAERAQKPEGRGRGRPKKSQAQRERDAAARARAAAEALADVAALPAIIPDEIIGPGGREYGDHGQGHGGGRAPEHGFQDGAFNEDEANGRPFRADGRPWARPVRDRLEKSEATLFTLWAVGKMAGMTLFHAADALAVSHKTLQRFLKDNETAQIAWQRGRRARSAKFALRAEELALAGHPQLLQGMTRAYCGIDGQDDEDDKPPPREIVSINPRKMTPDQRAALRLLLKSGDADA